MEDKNYYSRIGYVSNSSFNYLKISPKLFKKYIDGQVEKESKDYFRFGQLVHLKILEPQEFNDTVLVFDYETPRSAQQKIFIESLVSNTIDDTFLILSYRNQYSTKESDEKVLEKAKKLLNQFEDYYKYILLKDAKTIISRKELESIKEIELNCRNHKAVNELLFDLPYPLSKDGVHTYNEYEVLWNYNGVKCKSLIDRHIVDTNTKTIKLIDFKTTSKLHDFYGSFKDFNYDNQLVFYTMALKKSLYDLLEDELKDYKWEWYIEACDTKTKEVKSFQLFEEDLAEAKLEVKQLLYRAQWHIENDKWDHSMEYYLGDGHERLCEKK